MTRRAPLLLALALAAPAPARAQIARAVSLGAGVAMTRVRVAATGGTALLTGTTAFGSGRIGFRVLSLEGFYRQGTLKPDSGAAASQDLVEAAILAVARPLAWLSVAAGPHVRTYVVPGASERWVFIEGRVRGEIPVVGDRVRTHVEAWTSVSASTNVPGSSGSARGGEAGLTVLMRTSPVWLRLAYAIDRAQLTGTARTETLEDVRLSIGYGLPWPTASGARQ